MTKVYYIAGALLLGLGGYLLYNKIKNGNISYNFRNEDNVAQAQEGSHLSPPMQAPDTPPPLATPTIT